MKKELAVRKTVTVNAPQKHAFTVFTEGHGAWWPLETHHIGAQTPQTVIIEPRAGGRWFERAVDGTECDWSLITRFGPGQPQRSTPPRAGEPQDGLAPATRPRRASCPPGHQ
jgi:hypothetical protein